MNMADVNRIILTLIVALLSWSTFTTYQLAVGVAVIQEKLSVLEQKVERLDVRQP